MLKLIWITLCFTFSCKTLAVETDYLVLSWSAADGLLVDFHAVVDLPTGFKQKSSSLSQQNILLMGADGSVLDEVSVAQASYTRSEHHGHDQIEGQWLMNEELTFVVRAAKGQVKYLSLPFELDKNQSLIVFNDLIKQAKNKAPKAIQQARGSVDNRINLLIMGDGYTANQASDFDADVDSVIAYMQTFEPYQSYTEFISYDRLFTASSESGADKPTGCFGANAVTVDTAFDGSYCIASIRRLLTVNSSKIYTAAAARPDWDEIIVIVNDEEYGGSGGAFSTFSTHPAANDIFIHEYGHSFTGLADEYDSAYPGYPACSDLNGPNCEANVTDVTIRDNIKWSYFIDPSTPVPTPETSQYSEVTGLFEGARYLQSSMYRPKDACNMRLLARDFCQVCQQAYVFKLYQVPYAQGSSLSLIEPESADPASLTPTAMQSVPMTFSVDTLQPSHDLDVTWLVNGLMVASSSNGLSSQSHVFVPTQVGLNTVTVRVKDNAPMVHSSRQPELPEFELQWQVNVVADNDLIFADGFE